jgi:hypothetical protein
MPTFKGKDGKDRFTMNPQIASAMGSSQAPAAAASPDMADPNADTSMPDTGDSVEIHHGGNPQGQPPMTDAHAFHTIHHKGVDSGMGGGMDQRDDAALNSGVEIHNHENYDEAEADARNTMNPGDGSETEDGGDGADTPGDGSDEG